MVTGRPRTRSSRKVSFSENISEFFKVYIPRFSAQQLGIPQAFVRNVHGIIPRNVILKDSTGRQWHGSIEEVAGDLVLKNGWKSFATQHSLEYGDFLIFKYDGDSLFDVKIFGKNGCVKEETSIATMNTTHVKKEEETEAEQISSRADCACKQKHSKNVLERIAISGATGSSIEVAGYIVPKNPHFVSTFMRSANFCLSVSVPVLKSHGIKLKQDITLCDQNGDKWPVKVGFRRDGRIALSSGWSDFRKKNRIKIGDKCVFEFVLGRGKTCKEMKVQLVRAGAASPKCCRQRTRKT